MKALINAMRYHAALLANQTAQVRIGTISSYDPDAYAVKVLIQPENVESGWLPLLSPWIGNGWGLFAPPSIGDLTEVHFIDGDFNVGVATLRFFNDVDQPLPAPSGEFWLVHKTGSLLRFHNDGSVELTTNQDLNVTAGRDANVSVARNANVAVTGTISSNASQWNHTGPVKVTGTLQVTSQITGQGGLAISGGGGATVQGNIAQTSGNFTTSGSVTATGDVHGGGISLDSHVHSGVQSGGSNTGGPH